MEWVKSRYRSVGLTCGAQKERGALLAGVKQMRNGERDTGNERDQEEKGRALLFLG